MLRLRNWIAHHDLIFQRDLVTDLRSIRRVVGYRCSATLNVLDHEERLTHALDRKPIFGMGDFVMNSETEEQKP